MSVDSNRCKFEHVSDEELVRLSLDNKENFYFLMKRYEKKLLRYIHRITDITQQESEDILQDIFIKVFCNLNGFKLHLRFSNWIYRITRNEIINSFYKKQSRSQDLHLKLDNDDICQLSRFIDDSGDPDQVLILREKAAKIRELLKKLPVKYREVLILRYLEEKKYDEISDILQKPPGSVASLINRAKLRFKKIVKNDILWVNND